MSRPGPRQELQALKVFLAKIERQFLAKHLGKSSLGTPSEAESLDVAAYVVLAHGAFENFAEGVGLWTVGRVRHNWQMQKRTTRATASLLLHLGRNPPADDESRTVYDTLRLALDDAKSVYSQDIGLNHGVELRHLRSVFRRLGVDVPEDPTLVASLDLLVKMRHQWAHQYRFSAKTLKTAADVRTTVGDCLKLASELVANVGKVRP